MDWGLELRVSDFIALMALVVATLSWLDSRRRLTQGEVGFSIDRTDDNIGYRLWHTGSRRLFDVEVDPRDVLGFAMPFPASTFEMEPGESVRFILHPNRFGNLPDSVRVNYRLKGTSKPKSVNVRFPQRDGSSSERPGPPRGPLQTPEE